MTVSMRGAELTCVEHSTWIGSAWCTILSRRPPAISHTSFHLPADEGTSYDSIARLVVANLRGALHADWLCMVHDTVPAAPFHITHFVSPSSCCRCLT